MIRLNRWLNFIDYNRNVSYFTSLSNHVNNLAQHTKTVKQSKNRKGLFGHQVLADSNGFYIFRQNAITRAEYLVNEAISDKRNRKIVQIFDELSNSLCKVADLAEFIRIAHPDRNYTNAAEQASIAINAEVERLNTNRVLYDSLLKVVQNNDIVPTTPTDDYVTKLFLFDFEQCGIHLDDKVRNEIVRLNEHILHVGTYFMYGTTKPRIVLKKEIPEHLWKYFSIDNDKLVISGLQNESNDSQLREISFNQFLQYDDHQEQLLLELIYSRLKLAKICGFNSFAHRAINGSIAGSPELVRNLIDTVNNLIRHKSEKDFNYMLKLKSEETGNLSAQLMQWDVPYYTQSHKIKKFGHDITQSSPYFSIGSCMEGLNLIFQSIFNVELKIDDTTQEDLWHPSVMKLSVNDQKTNKILGYIYCDFFVRSNKPYNDCHFTIQGGCDLPNGKLIKKSKIIHINDCLIIKGEYQLPIVVVFLNFPNATSYSPTLLTPSMVDNLFHEMGHAMHSMLARTPYQHITGTRCSTDLAEVPSILMEHFANDPRVVSKFAKHYQTGKPIPENLLHSWVTSKHLFNSSDLQLQIFYSALDQFYHSENPMKGCKNTTDVLNMIQNQYYGISNSSNTSWQLRFGHLVGYGAKYYSYLVSKAVANSIWNKLFINDPFSSAAGQIYHDKVLAHGGGKPPKEIVESILDETITANFLAKSLVDNIESNK